MVDGVKISQLLRCCGGGLAQLVTTLVRSTKLLYAGLGQYIGPAHQLLTCLVRILVL